MGFEGPEPSAKEFKWRQPLDHFVNETGGCSQPLRSSGLCPLKSMLCEVAKASR